MKKISKDEKLNNALVLLVERAQEITRLEVLVEQKQYQADKLDRMLNKVIDELKILRAIPEVHDLIYSRYK